jgi:EPS-associated MarR family transcriptional regulator
MTTRHIAQKIGISNGSTYYLSVTLVDKGLIKLSNFKENKKKIKYSYYLTPKGIQKKSLIVNKYLIRKRREFNSLKNEITMLERDIGLDIVCDSA